MIGCTYCANVSCKVPKFLEPGTMSGVNIRLKWIDVHCQIGNTTTATVKCGHGIHNENNVTSFGRRHGTRFFPRAISHPENVFSQIDHHHRSARIRACLSNSEHSRDRRPPATRSPPNPPSTKRRLSVTVYEVRTSRAPRGLSWCSSLTSMSTFYLLSASEIRHVNRPYR
jgi:hypothetical protein